MTTGMIRLNVDEWYVDRGPWVLDAHRAVAMVLESLRIRTAQGLDCSAFSEGARDVTLMSDLRSIRCYSQYHYMLCIGCTLRESRYEDDVDYMTRAFRSWHQLPSGRKTKK